MPAFVEHPRTPMYRLDRDSSRLRHKPDKECGSDFSRDGK
jgi:hypothetical protein